MIVRTVGWCFVSADVMIAAHCCSLGLMASALHVAAAGLALAVVLVATRRVL